jgi:hypothetical protein
MFGTVDQDGLVLAGNVCDQLPITTSQGFSGGDRVSDLGFRDSKASLSGKADGHTAMDNSAHD